MQNFLMPRTFPILCNVFLMICISCLRNNHKCANLLGVLMRTDLNALSIVITKWITFGSDIFDVTIHCRKKEDLTKWFLNFFYLKIREVIWWGYKQGCIIHKQHHWVIWKNVCSSGDSRVFLYPVQPSNAFSPTFS